MFLPVTRTMFQDKLTGVGVNSFMVIGALTTQARLTHAQNSRADMPPASDPGHNAHQETVIFACFGVVSLMLILVGLLLWFLMDRSKREIRELKRILPQIVGWMKERAEACDDVDAAEDNHGTLRATEFEGGFVTTSSSGMQNSSLEMANYKNKRRAHAYWHPSRQSYDVTEVPTNHVTSSGHDVRQTAHQNAGTSAATEHATTSATHNQIAKREIPSTVATKNRPANHNPGPTRVIDRTADQSEPFVLQTSRQPGPSAPHLSPRVHVSGTSKQPMKTSPYAYDNPNMRKGDITTDVRSTTTLPQAAASQDTKQRYRNSYYESHV